MAAAESSAVTRRAGVVALGTFASRVLGMLRESVLAALFSVAVTDAFFIAYTIPNTLRMLLGEGAVSNAFIPVYADLKSRAGDGAARRFLARFTGTLTVLLAAASILGVVAAPLFAWAYAGGFVREPERFELVISLIRWLFPFLGLAGLGALAAGVLNVAGSFGVPAFAPALINVAMIAAPFALLPFHAALGLEPITTVAIGALVGGVLQLLVQLVPLRKIDLLPRPELVRGDPDVRRALGLMGPLLLGLGVYQLNMLLSRLFASFLPAGAPSFLSYGQRVIEVPQGMFALALASATLPTLVRLRSEQKHEELLSLFRYSLRLTLFIAIPASVALFALAEPTTAVLFGRGKFSGHNVIETGRSLAWQAAGVWAVAAVRATVPMFAAHADTRTPVKASAVNLAVFLVLTTLLMGTLSHVALAFANSAASAVQLVVLLLALRRHTGPLGLRAVAHSAARITLASLVMAGVLVVVARQVDWTDSRRELWRGGCYLGIAVLGLGVFFICARLLGVPEVRELLDAVRRRRKRAT